MRKLKLQVQISIDGYVAGPNSEMDWMAWNWGDDIKGFGMELTAPVDTILLGRKMTDGFINHWAMVAGDEQNPEYAFGKKMHDTHKVVFTKTLKESPWPNTVLATGDITEEVNKLKKQEGGDIIVYGGASLVASLIENNLIDEYNLFVNPTAIGDGMKIFNGRTKLELIKSLPFSCGINVLIYKPAIGA